MYYVPPLVWVNLQLYQLKKLPPYYDDIGEKELFWTTISSIQIACNIT